jgi:HPt (histidine-containing phosphotransfer) domain-containing protein
LCANIGRNGVTTNQIIPEVAREASACCQAAEPLPSDVLDLEGLRSRCMGNIDLVERVLNTFQQRIPEEMAAMESAFQQNDAEQVARVAHRVKGCSASMSAGRLAQAAAEIEEAARGGRVTEVPANIQHLHQEWEQYLDRAAVLLREAATA